MYSDNGGVWSGLGLFLSVRRERLPGEPLQIAEQNPDCRICQQGNQSDYLKEEGFDYWKREPD